MTFSNELFSDYYHNLKYISSGTYARVYSCKRITDNKKFAVKIISKNTLNKKETHKILQEINILSTLKHKNILKLYGTYETANNYYLVLEYCKGGDLYQLLQHINNHKFNEYQTAYTIYKLTNVIKYLHDHGIIHRDLKLENMLLTKNGFLKISDFGLSHYDTSSTKKRTMYSAVGTPFYASPELLKHGYYGYGVDYWSLGVILYILLSGTLPFYSNNITILYDKIINGKYNFTSKIWQNISKSAKNLIKGLLNIDPKKRFGYKDVIKSQWLFEKLKRHSKKKKKSKKERL